MATIPGTNSDDTFENSLQDLEGDDLLQGLAGEDWFRMLVGGTDTVDGGDGDGDTIFYNDYTTGLTIDLKAGFVTDTLGNTDTLIGVEAAHGGTAGDSITMGDDGGYVFARAGNDTIRAGKNGSFVVAGSGADTVIGGAGFDTVDFSGDDASSGFDSDGGGFITHGAVVNLKTGKATDAWGDTDTLTGIEEIRGTKFADNITGDARGNVLRGGGGNDRIDGGGVPMKGGAPTYEEQDEIFGEDGDDTITITGLGSVDGGKGKDTITATGEGYINGGLGNDRIFGKSLGFNGDFDYVGVGFNDATKGIVANLTAKKQAGVSGGSNSKGYNITDGQGGTDKVSGIHGVDDTRFGDKFFVDGSVKNSYGGQILINLTGGNDSVKVIGSGQIAINYGAAQGGVKIDWNEDLATDIGKKNNIGKDQVVGDVTHTRGSNFKDSIAGAGNDENIRGRLGNDDIWSRGGNDKLWGDEKENKKGDGNDKLYGGAGNDWLRGGGGEDTFVFDTKLDKKKNVDKIDDFTVTDDTIALDNAIFAVGKTGKLKGSLFADSKSAIDDDTRIVYHKKSGALTYDADGSGKDHSEVKFAEIENGAKLTAADFIVV